MGLFDGMRQRQKARQKRRATRQRSKQKRRQTRAEGRWSEAAVAGRQGLIGQLGGQAMSIGASALGLGQGDAMAAYTGDPGGGEFVEVDYAEPGMDPLILAIGAAAVVGVGLMVAKK